MGHKNSSRYCVAERRHREYELWLARKIQLELIEAREQQLEARKQRRRHGTVDDD